MPIVGKGQAWIYLKTLFFLLLPLSLNSVAQLKQIARENTADKHKITLPNVMFKYSILIKKISLISDTFTYSVISV